MCNHKFLSFFLGKLLPVNSFQKVDFWISLFTAKSQMLDFHVWLGSQAAIFEFLKSIKIYVTMWEYFISQRRVVFFLYNQKIWNRKYYNEIKYVGIFE